VLFFVSSEGEAALRQQFSPWANCEVSEPGPTELDKLSIVSAKKKVKLFIISSSLYLSREEVLPELPVISAEYVRL
jgi:hypothetical protein